MSHYVDGFVIPLPKSKLDDYIRIASVAKEVWLSHGALQYVETIGDDLNNEQCQRPFPKLAGTGEDESVVFSWILYRSKEERDEINAKVMADPRMQEVMENLSNPLDCSTMTWGGFRTIVSSLE